jgi:hypothetical protein
MRLFLRFTIALSLLIFGLSTVVSAQSSFLITQDSVGRLKVGMTVAEARRIFPRHTFTRTSDGEGIALIEVKRRNQTHFMLYANEFDPEQPINNNAKIVFIEIVNPAYRTAKGVSPNMRLIDVERRYGKLKSITLSEIESREYARFTNQPLGIDFKVAGRNAQAGIYQSGQTKTTRYSRNAYVRSIILLGDTGAVDNGDGSDGNGTTVELGFASKYTNLGKQCQTPKGQGDDGGHISTYCEGFDGYRVHIFDTAKSMEIAVESEDKNQSIPIASQSLGFDINSKQVEWRFKDGKAFAIIMRTDQYRMDSSGLIRYPVRKTGEFLVIKGLPGYEQIDYKINVRTTRNANEEARKRADEGYSLPDNTAKKFESLDIAPWNRTIANAARRNRAWVKSPLQVAVRLAGEIKETRTRTMEYKFPSAEENNIMTLTVTNEGLLDDSVRAERFVFDLKKDSRGVWTINSAQKSWSCYQNRGHQDFSAAPCN